MERNTGRDTNKKKPLSKKAWTGILVGLCGIVMVLVIVIVVVAVNNNKPKEEKSVYSSIYLRGLEIGESETEQQVAGCLDAGSDAGIISCLEETANEKFESVTSGEEEEARAEVVKLYSTAVDMLNRGNYRTEAANVLSQQAMTLAINGDCAGAAAIFEEDKLTEYNSLLKAFSYS